MLNATFNYLTFLSIGSLLVSCAAGENDTGLEYAPQMYHAVSYEPLKQITDKNAGNWLDSNDEDGYGEFYNSNPYNPFMMTMRRPVANTVRRGESLPYRYSKDDLEVASAVISPLDTADVEVVKKGKELYERYCQHCHGEQGNADGKVAEAFAGVANLHGAAYLDLTEGHIFHVITYGKGLMGTHGSQVSPRDRWRIARYIKELQKK